MKDLPREDGAWYMALTCWICGWVAAGRMTWEPAALAGAAFMVFAAVQAGRAYLRLRAADRDAAGGAFHRGIGALSVASVALLAAFSRTTTPGAVAALMIPGAIYAPLLLLRVERHPVARIAAIAGLTTLAPLTCASARGSVDAPALQLWAVLAAYYVLGALFIMARLRRSARLLAVGRIGSLAALAGLSASIATGRMHWILLTGFVLLTSRLWAFRPAGPALPPRVLGKRELAFSSLAALCIALGFLFR